MLLKDIKVIDFSQYIPGSYASLRLADLGAEVIKIEPLLGSPIRSFGKEKGAEGVIFAAYNRGKKSIALNLKEPKGQKIALELIKQADVVIESFRHGVMKSFTLDYESTKKIKKDLIYISLTGYGQQGILSNYGSHDLNYLALGGILAQFKDNEGKPVFPKITFADIIGGLAASEKILSALVHRERTGEGQYIDLALMDEVFSLIKTNAFTYKAIGKENVIDQLEGNLVSYNIYETKDKRFVSLAALEYKFWKNFCEAVDRQDWLNGHLTIQSSDNNLFQELRELFFSRTLEEWTKFSLEVDCCLTPILEINELETHPYIKEKELTYFDISTSALGEDTNYILENIISFKNLD